MEEENSHSQQPAAEILQLSMSKFLETVPPNQWISVPDLTHQKAIPGHYQYFLSIPKIKLHCPDDACNGTRFFRCVERHVPQLEDGKQLIWNLTYLCSNCRKKEKIFSLALIKDEGKQSGSAAKLGELPPFGPPIPARLVKLIGPDRELLLKGRRCENQGLGIGAFVYYRRVVESQKVRIFNKIIEVAKKLKTSAPIIAELEAARDETQFSKALSMVKEGIPPTLLINGHNPLSLLHTALSEGVHDRSDEECLQLARSARVVLIELAESLGQALKDGAVLKHAVKTLLDKRDKKELS
jgi:hypothetical protein